MGRKSSLTEKQWDEIEERLLKGEKAASLAKEYGIDRAAISRKFSQQIATVKSVANQVIAAESALKALPIAQQVIATDLINQLRSISGHLASGANYGAATFHRLSGIAHVRSAEIDDTKPLDDDGREVVKDILALTRTANEAAATGLNLLNANKNAVRPEPEKIMTLEEYYGDEEQ